MQNENEIHAMQKYAKTNEKNESEFVVKCEMDGAQISGAQFGAIIFQNKTNFVN